MSRRRAAAGALVVAAAVLAFLLLQNAISDPGSARAEEVLQKAATAATSPRDAGIRSLVATWRVVVYFLGDQRMGVPALEIAAEAWYEAPDRQRIELAYEARSPDGSAPTGNSRLQVWDGTDYWTYDSSERAVTVLRQERGADVFEDGRLLGAVPAEAMGAMYASVCRTASVTGEETIAGRDVYVLELGRPRCGLALPGNDGRSVLWADKETGLILRSESHAADGRLSVSAQVTHLEINGTVDPDRFTFIPPADAVLHNHRELVRPGTFPRIAPPTPISLEEARAEATFGILTPLALPDGFELESVEHYWGNELARALRSHADWVLLRYVNAEGDWLAITQGFGGPLAALAAAAPDDARQGAVRVRGSDAQWVDGSPTTGWESGAMTLLSIEAGRIGGGWATGPDGGTLIGSPFHMALASNALTVAQLVAVAESAE